MDTDSGTEAGYMFAKEHQLTQQEVFNSTTKSASFRKGMQQYVDEQTALQQKKQST